MPTTLPTSPAAEFAAYAKCLMLARGYGDAERMARWAPERVQRLITKGPVSAGSLADVTDYNIMVGGFSASLRTKSAYFRMWDDNAFVRAPMRTRLGLIISNGAVGAAVAEGASIPLSKIVLETNFVLEVRKAAAMIAMTRELAENMGASGQALFSKELQNATALAIDSAFLAAVIDASDTGSLIASAGSDPAEAAQDLRSALLQIDLHADSKLYWILSPASAARAAALASQGMFVHGAMSPLGGELINIPALVSDAVAADQIHLVDASAIAADLGTIDLVTSGQGDVLMADDPPMNATGPVAAQMVSLFQSNSVALRSTIYFASERLRPNCIATIDNVDWGA